MPCIVDIDVGCHSGALMLFYKFSYENLRANEGEQSWKNVPANYVDKNGHTSAKQDRP